MANLPIKEDVFDELGVGAGILLTEKPTIDPDTNEITVDNASILGATRGGFTFNPTPQSRERSVDGLAPNTVGAAIIDYYRPTLTATFITANPKMFGLALGLGDITGYAVNYRHNIKSADYHDYYILQALSGGGAYLLHIINGLAQTNGSTIRTNANGETEVPVTIVGNYSLSDQDTAPYDLEFIPAPVEPTPEPETAGAVTE